MNPSLISSPPGRLSLFSSSRNPLRTDETSCEKPLKETVCVRAQTLHTGVNVRTHTCMCFTPRQDARPPRLDVMAQSYHRRRDMSAGLFFLLSISYSMTYGK